MALPIPDPFSAVLTGGTGPMLNGGTAGPSSAMGGKQGGLTFDKSGQNINFGGGTITSSATKTGELSQYMPYIVVGIAGLLAWRYLKKR